MNGKEGFSPAETNIGVGDQVTFVNKAEKATTLTVKKVGTTKTITSDLIKVEGEWQHAFTEAGTYEIWSVSYGVKAKVIVE